jgi:hypothetical protein
MAVLDRIVPGVVEVSRTFAEIISGGKAFKERCQNKVTSLRFKILRSDNYFLRRIVGLFNEKNRKYELKRWTSKCYFILTPFLNRAMVNIIFLDPL